MGSHDAIAEIEHVLSLWPSDRKEPEEHIRTRLKSKIDDELPLPSLRTVADGKWRRACQPRVYSGIAKCLLIDTKSRSERVMMELRLRSGKWVVTYFESECPVCFGSGINESQICSLCFGIGWGAY